MSRLQKERDEAKSECKELHDKLEIQQTQFQKILREKEILHAELEVYKERLDKLQSSVQKIHVSVSVFLSQFTHPPFLANVTAKNFFSHLVKMEFEMLFRLDFYSLIKFCHLPF